MTLDEVKLEVMREVLTPERVLAALDLCWQESAWNVLNRAERPTYDHIVRVSRASQVCVPTLRVVPR